MQKVDERDLNTPDAWIPRDPRLIRLTGNHPFNAEPPLCSILETPTPSNLHYVRNHGSVPKLDWNTHRISVTGLIDHPRDYSMQELLEKPSIRLRTCRANPPAGGFHFSNPCLAPIETSLPHVSDNRSLFRYTDLEPAEISPLHCSGAETDAFSELSRF